MNNEWQVRVDQQMGKTGYQIYIFRLVDMGVREFLVKGGTEAITVTNDKPRNTEDLIFAELPDDSLAPLLLQALEKRGIPLPSKDYTHGKLEATEKHLEDMRRLAFADPRDYRSIEQVDMGPIDLGAPDA